ncbi:hypothetical protein BH09PSE5_BH09PSE5_26250 [soil metagenome]
MGAGRLMFALAATVLAAGCGGGDDESTPTVAASAASSAASAASAAKLAAQTCVVRTQYFLDGREAAPSARVLKVSSDACGRPVPYKASFALSVEGVASKAVASVEADFDGDGVADLKVKALGNPGAGAAVTTTATTIAYTYAAPGVFRARFTAMLVDGTRLDTYRYQTAMAAGDAVSLSGTVAGLSSAFRAQDVAKALTFFTAAAQERHGWALTAFKSQLPELATGLTTLRPSRLDEQHAQYEIPVTQEGNTVVYNIVLVRDETGAWKIDSL